MKNGYIEKMKASKEFWKARQERIAELCHEVAKNTAAEEVGKRICRVCGARYSDRNHPRCWNCRSNRRSVSKQEAKGR